MGGDNEGAEVGAVTFSAVEDTDEAELLREMGKDKLTGKKETSSEAVILEGRGELTATLAGKEHSSKTTCRDR